jgi:CYTH domain-containing protein/predicted ATPase
MLKICLTGGPGGGKSSAISTLTQVLSDRGFKVIIANEAATSLILAGIAPGKHILMEEFQEFVLDEQLNIENLCNRAAKYYKSDKVVIIHDRGLCDQMAYVDKTLFENMLKKRNLNLSDAYKRYDLVLHLKTAAIGAEKFYQWNDPTKESCGNNAARRESPEEAILKDKKTLESWIGHPHLKIIDNSTDFKGKLDRIIDEVLIALGEPTHKEIEKKFLIEMPTNEEIEKLGCLSKSNIVQTYLIKKDAKTERRIRQRSVSDGFNFYYTEKTWLENGMRHEVEDKITPEEYIRYLTEADTSLHQISKTRYCFVYKNKYYEMDIYSFDKNYAILEIEVNSINEKIELPPLKIISEVTNNESYKNSNIAKTLSFDVENNKKDNKTLEQEWIYETGREESEILGSGSSYYNVFKTKNEEEALKEAMNGYRNYLVRYKKKNGITISRQWYDGHAKIWIDN